jgi:hypothetical protein
MEGQDVVVREDGRPADFVEIEVSWGERRCRMQ